MLIQASIDVTGALEYVKTLKNDQSTLGNQSSGWSTQKTEFRPFQIETMLNDVELILHHLSGGSYLDLRERKRISWWAVCLPPGAEITKHSHSGDYSAIIYIDDNYEGGRLYIDDQVIIPERGKVVFFSSDLEHHVSPNTSNVDRYSIAVNRV